jgi:hypothetical protein
MRDINEASVDHHLEAVAPAALSLAIAGQDPGHSALVKPSLATRNELVDTRAH